MRDYDEYGSRPVRIVRKSGFIGKLVSFLLGIIIGIGGLVGGLVGGKETGKAEMLFTVSADKFMPPPKVTSSVVRIDLWKEKPIVPIDESLFFRTVKAAFEQRRKTLPNSLATGFPEISKERLTELIVSCGHRADVRGEKLSVADFCALSDAIYKELN